MKQIDYVDDERVSDFTEYWFCESWLITTPPRWLSKATSAVSVGAGDNVACNATRFPVRNLKYFYKDGSLNPENLIHFSLIFTFTRPDCSGNSHGQYSDWMLISGMMSSNLAGYRRNQFPFVLIELGNCHPLRRGLSDDFPIYRRRIRRELMNFDSGARKRHQQRSRRYRFQLLLFAAWRTICAGQRVE